MSEKMAGDGKIILSWEKDGDGFCAEMSGSNVDMLEVLTMNYVAFLIDQLASCRLKAKFISPVFAQLLARFGAGLRQTHPELMEKPEVLEVLPFLAAISDALRQGPAGVRADVEKVLGKELTDVLTAAIDRRSSPDVSRSPAVDPRSPVDGASVPNARSPVDERTAKEKARDAKLDEIKRTMQGGPVDGQRE